MILSSYELLFLFIYMKVNQNYFNWSDSYLILRQNVIYMKAYAGDQPKYLKNIQNLL